MQDKIIEIDPEHIREAEQILIPGHTFGLDRVNFIKDLTTCDLLAVPGSGKTTVLIAKLYCLAKHMPFIDGSGILVLAHTNHAVEEIENKLKKHCPQLFSYPNFVGTIQSFINKFLANQACFEKYNSYITKNDDDIIFKGLLGKIKAQRSKAYWKIYYTIKEDDKYDEKFIEILKSIRYNEEAHTLESKYFTYPLRCSTESGAELMSLFKENYGLGCLTYNDSYELSKWYLKQHHKINKLLQKRFKFVFIDEMQDLEKYQIDIIEEIFEVSSSSVIIQRIGDPNQSIYNSVKKECDWEPRATCYLKGSNRLTKEIADLVNCFILDRYKDEFGNPRFLVEGLRVLESKIKPHLVVFDRHNAGKLLNTFQKLILDNGLHEEKNGQKSSFNIIGWNAEWKNEPLTQNKIRLKDIFPEFTRELKAKKESFDCLKKHLQLYDSTKSVFGVIRKSILDAFVHILYLEGIKLPRVIRGKVVEKYYSRDDLINFIKRHGDNPYDDFKGKILKWCFNLVSSQYDNVFQEIKAYLETDFIRYFNFELNNSQKFIDSADYNFVTVDVEKDSYSKAINPSNKALTIDIVTVHSVKGQTHCATMYVETAYGKPVYETLKITKKRKNAKTSPLLFEEHRCDGVNDKSALKMMYVGFSRPTHLLCFAMLKDHFDENDKHKYENVGWIVRDITSDP